MSDSGRFDSLFKLMEFWWQRFEVRRQYFWRFSILIWTLLVLYVSVILTKSVNPIWSLCGLRVDSLILAVLAVAVHLVFVYDYVKMNRIDKGKANEFADAVYNELSFHFSEDLKKKDQERKDRLLKDSVLLKDRHLWITIVLAAMMLLLTCKRG